MKEQKNYSVADMADILHQASSLYMASNIPIDYGTGDMYTATEVHLLKYIIDNPAKTVTDLSRDWDKSKAAISMMMKKLEDKGLVYKETAPDSNKKQLYFATEKGYTLDESHREYDETVFSRNINGLRERYPEKDIQLCFQILTDYTQIRRGKHYAYKEAEGAQED